MKENTWLKRLIPARGTEYRVILLAGAYFFLLLMSYYLLRPLRESFGISRGADKLPYIWSCTLAVMALINPVYSALTARFRRRQFIPIVYHCFAAMLLLFGLLYHWLPDRGGAYLGYTFYVWLSVFNLFVISIFWSFMSDFFNKEAGQRLFGMIAIGGTLGAIAGASVTAEFSRWLGAEHYLWLFLFSAALLELAILYVMALFKLGSSPDSRSGFITTHCDVSREPSNDVMAGITQLGKSPILRSISLYILLYAVTGTFLYIFQGRIIEQIFETKAERTLAFARIDFWTNVLTLVTQLFFTHRLVARLGVPISVGILPFVTLLGFGGLWMWPGFAALAIVQVTRRGLHYAVDRPVREMLYIPLSADAKYKSKSFIDTFIYRTGDFVGVWITPMLEAMSFSIGLPGIGMSAVWLAGASRLGLLVKKEK